MTWRWWKRKRAPLDPSSKDAVRDAEQRLQSAMRQGARVNEAAQKLTDQIVRNRLGQVIEHALRGQQ